MNLGVLDWQALDKKSSAWRGSLKQSKNKTRDDSVLGRGEISDKSEKLLQREPVTAAASPAFKNSASPPQNSECSFSLDHSEILKDRDHGIRFDPIVQKIDSEGKFSDLLMLMRGCLSCCCKIQGSLDSMISKFSDEIDQGGRNMLAKYLPRHRSTVIHLILNCLI